MKRFLWVAAAFLLIGVLGAGSIAGGMLFVGWWSYKRHETSIVDKMDKYFLNLTNPGQAEYLLEDDELFEVPYMASKLSVEAVPTRIYDAKDRLLGEYLTEKGVYVRSPEELPAFLKKALVASEDGTFYAHAGLNYKALARATWTNLLALRVKQGGSTLTQQLAKVMFTARKKTYGRKIFEAFCARKLEQKFTKDQILLMYLNFAYFGHGAFGVESAAQYYFGKSARSLELTESAMLVGIIPNPNRYSPFEDRELCAARHRTVLRRMAKLGFIPESSVERYSKELWKRLDERVRDPEVSFWRMRVNEAPYAVEYVRRSLEKEFSKERILKGGLRIRTTFDLDVQRAAQTALRSGLAALRSEFARKDGPQAPLEGALAAVDPADGGILALAGGSAFNFQNQLNRALDIRRPVGSAVKPFVYAAALRSGKVKPDDELVDEPARYRVGGGKWWTPQNYERKHAGPVTLARALQRSINTVAVKLLQEAGIPETVRLLSEASGQPESVFPRNLSLALGTAELSPLQLASAYAVFANGGRAVRPRWLRAIEDRDGAVLREERAAPEAAQVLEPELAVLLRDILTGVLGPGGSAGGAAARTGFTLPAAGKTGTTSDYRDAWFAGVTPDIAAAVWIGFDDMRVSLGESGTGGAVAAPIWMNFLKDVYRTRPTRAFGAAREAAAH